MKCSFEGVRDVLFPSDNEEGIPFLDPNLCGDVIDFPVVCWGRLNRSSVRSARTIHFYTDDSRFSHLWAKPDLLTDLPVVTVVEPNYSIADSTPRAVVLWRTYQKRWLARYWQLYGVRVIVDVNVPERYWADNLLGVPLGWDAFAIRGYNGQTSQSIRDAYFQCLEWSGRDDILFFVYGGGASVANLCMQHRWLWLPEDVHRFDRRRQAKVVRWVNINEKCDFTQSRKRKDTRLTLSTTKRQLLLDNTLKAGVHLD